MNTVQGSISDLQSQTIEGGARTTFRLHSADGKETSVETRLNFPYHNGDMVQASGEVDSDLVLQAVSIAPVAAPTTTKKGFPWVWVIAAAVVLLVVIFALKPSAASGSTLTVAVNNCGKAAVGASISLVAPNGVLTPCITDAGAKCVFSNLAKGSYAIKSGARQLQTIVLDGKQSLSTSVGLTTPCVYNPKFPPIKLNDRVLKDNVVKSLHK